MAAAQATDNNTDGASGSESDEAAATSDDEAVVEPKRGQAEVLFDVLTAHGLLADSPSVVDGEVGLSI